MHKWTQSWHIWNDYHDNLVEGGVSLFVALYSSGFAAEHQQSFLVSSYQPMTTFGKQS